MSKTTTQFIWQDCLQMKAFEPTESKKSKYAIDEHCYLCGGKTHGLGHHIKDVLSAGFTDNNIAKNVKSKAVCDSCTALMKKEGWELSCAKQGVSPYFPVKDDKPPFLSNWMFNSHCFSLNGWKTMSRQESRDTLINPPKTNFVITLADSGKKHVIFRAKVNTNNNNFFVQLDEYTILINHELFLSTLKDFEYGYNLGLSKESMLTGAYNQATVLKVGINKVRDIENKIKEVRLKDNGLLSVVSYCAYKSK